MRHIASEQQAEQIGIERTNGVRGKDFEIHWYEHARTRVTLFSVQIIATGEEIAFA